MKILFVHHKRKATFIQNDLKILQKHYDVEDFHYTPGKTLQLFKKIKECDLVYVWFISYPAFLVTQINKIYKKPVILVAGGYGVQPDVLKKHKVFKLMSKSAIKNATKILAVSRFTRNEVYKLACEIFSTGDYLVFRTSQRVEIIYNGIDITLFKDHKIRDNKNSIALTVGNIFSMDRYYLKGIDRFIDVARKNPSWKFYVIGMCNEIANHITDVPSNCYLLAPVPQEDLIFYYNTADTYYQLSKYESFCLTLAEAVACGCKVVTSTEKTAMDEIMSVDIKTFDIKNREKRLIEVLDEYTD